MKNDTNQPAFGVWQPIATVPKDGTWILVTCGGKHVPHVARWNSKRQAWETDDGVYYGSWPLSHWMPLPPPPPPANACPQEISSLKGERDRLSRELSDICAAADAHTSSEACVMIKSMREAIQDADAALRKCLKYMLGIPSCGSDQECETMDDAHRALSKLQPFIKL